MPLHDFGQSPLFGHGERCVQASPLPEGTAMCAEGEEGRNKTADAGTIVLIRERLGTEIATSFDKPNA